MPKKTKTDMLCELVVDRMAKTASKQSVKRYFIAMVDVMLYQLKVNGEITIPKFGNFKLVYKEEKNLKLGDVVNGGVKYLYCKPKYDLVFTPYSMLLKSINENDFKYRKITDAQIKRNNKDIPMGQTVADMFNRAEDRKYVRDITKKGKNNGKTKV